MVKPPWFDPELVSATALAIPYGNVAPGKTLPTSQGKSHSSSEPNGTSYLHFDVRLVGPHIVTGRSQQREGAEGAETSSRDIS